MKKSHGTGDETWGKPGRMSQACLYREGREGHCGPVNSITESTMNEWCLRDSVGAGLAHLGGSAGKYVHKEREIQVTECLEKARVRIE